MGRPAGKRPKSELRDKCISIIRRIPLEDFVILRHPCELSRVVVGDPNRWAEKIEWVRYKQGTYPLDGEVAKVGVRIGRRKVELVVILPDVACIGYFRIIKNAYLMSRRNNSIGGEP